MQKIIYLACPYSHPNERMRNARFRAITKMTSDLLKQGHIVYSPITYGHTCAEWGQLPTNWEFWKNLCEAFLIKCDELIVVEMPGWKESIGVKAEIDFAVDNDIHITHLEYNEALYGNIEQEVAEEEKLISEMEGWYKEEFGEGEFKPRKSIAERYSSNVLEKQNYLTPSIQNKYIVGQVVEIQPYRSAPCSGGPDLIVDRDEKGNYVMFSGDKFDVDDLMDMKGTVYQIQYAYKNEEVPNNLDPVIYADMLTKWRKLNNLL